jgi:BON domain
VRKLFAAAFAASLTLYGAGQGWAQDATIQSPAANSQPNRLQLSPDLVGGSVTPSSNQRIADAIADRLNQSPMLKGFHVNISVQEGVADLAGTVMTQGQRAAVLELAQAVPGVIQVHDRLQVVLPGEVQTAQAAPLSAGPFQPVPPGGGLPKAFTDPKQPMPPFAVPNPSPFPPQGPPMGGMPGPGGMLEPMPLHSGPPGFPSATQPPPMPPNAWPTYAPYNNYSRVAYPTLYPYESFPFIGPFYPFPKVPLGWRSVTLSWEDGHWWLGRNATGHDWWRVRYW